MYKINYKKLYFFRQWKLEFGLWLIACTVGFLIYQVLFRETSIFNRHWFWDIMLTCLGIFVFSVISAIITSSGFLLARVKIHDFKKTMVFKIIAAVVLSVVTYFLFTNSDQIDLNKISGPFSRTFSDNLFGNYIALLSALLTYILNNFFHQILVIRPNFKSDDLVDRMNREG